MGWTDETPHLKLPLFADGDKPSWRGDFNYAMSIVDSNVGNLGTIAVANYLSEPNPIQAAHDAAEPGQTVLLPGGNTLINTPVNITKPIHLIGMSTYGSRILTDGCDGIIISEGVKDVKLQGFEIVTTRYTTTPNTLRGVRALGSTTLRPSAHTYRDIFIDGFHTAIETNYLWSSLFDGVRANNGLRGIVAYGLSVNNFVRSCQINVVQTSDSRGVALIGRESATNSAPVGSEGWVISGNLIFGAGVGIELQAVPHVAISGNIIDFNQVNGVLLQGNGVNFSGNTVISDNYIAMDDINGVAAINVSNAQFHTSNTYNRISNNHMHVYTGGVCSYGVFVAASTGKSIITGNSFGNSTTGFSVNDINLVCSNAIVTDNACNSSVVNNINTKPGEANLVDNNIGTIAISGAGSGKPNSYAIIGGRKVSRWVGPPTIGDFQSGDRIINFNPQVGQPKGWVCTVSGAPGTWVSEGAL